MNENNYRLSILRIFDLNKEVDKLTKEEKENAFNKYRDNIDNFAVSVQYVNGIYSIQNNYDFYFVCRELKVEKINVKIKIESLEKIILSLKSRAKKEILNPMMSSILYDELIQIGGMSQKEIAEFIGKSQGAISNKMRLLKLPTVVQNQLILGNIKERHGRAILQLSNEKNYISLSEQVLNKIIENKLKVSETEDVIYKILGKEVGIRDNLNIKKIEKSNSFIHPTAGAVIRKVDTELNNAINTIKKFYPNLEINLDQGIDRKDYVFLLKLKGINK